AGLLRSNGWGFDTLEIEPAPLGSGRISLRRASGVFPDGTPFSMPDDDPLPPVLEVEANTRDTVVYLTLPLRRAGGVDAVRNDSTGNLARFAVAKQQARDSTVDTTVTADIEVGAMRARLALGNVALADFACLPLGRIRSCGPDRKLELDKLFMP